MIRACGGWGGEGHACIFVRVCVCAFVPTRRIIYIDASKVRFCLESVVFMVCLFFIHTHTQQKHTQNPKLKCQ